MPNCPKCGSQQTTFRGSQNRPNLYQCKQCTKYFTDRGDPKVLVFDIETLPVKAFVWGTGKQYVSHKNIIQDYAILSWAAKWLFSDSTMADILTSQEAKDYNDKRLLERIWKLLDTADCVITQNGIQFDVKKLNARFAYYGMNPPRPYHHIDTLQAARAAFSLSSFKLDYATQYFGVGKKIETDFELWVGCANGNSKSLKEMLTYNKNDIWILEDYYARIRAWVPNHPNFSAYTHRYVDLKEGESVCPVCRHVISESALDDKYRTPLGYVYRSFRCPHCGVVGRLNERDKQKISVRKAG